ncbi:MAG TPA: hypothetical protein VFN30_07470 [Chitinophagaceae bacterium]|nr:hypothetical protein [Chitinophagaceae bacterium]
MKKNLSLNTWIFIVSYFIFISCSHKNYSSGYFEQQTAGHKIIAILPAEMIFTGIQPKNITSQQIDSIEESESKIFQASLQNSILHYANTRRYYMTVSIQDINTTLNLMEQHNVSLRDSWKMNAKDLCKILNVDAVVRLTIVKQRYMSDYASYGVNVAEKILGGVGRSRLPIPSNAGKTNDISVTCNLLSENITLWNDYYKGISDWNTPPNIVIGNITDRFGERFPYKKRR